METRATKGPCQYFTLGCCKFETDAGCQYSHDRNLCKPGTIKEPCKHFVEGYCRNGRFCLYLHDLASRGRLDPKEQDQSGERDKNLTLKAKIKVPRPRNLNSLEQSRHSPVDKSLGSSLNDVQPEEQVSQELYNLNLAESQPTYYYGATQESSISASGAVNTGKRAWQAFASSLKLSSSNQEESVYEQAQICKYYMSGFCKYGDRCRYLHQSEQKTHEERLQLDHERALSKRLECSICLEVISEKKDPRFGVLPECSHVFCLECIKSWRSTQVSDKQHEEGLLRSCPSCRKISNYIIPSNYFPHSEEVKLKLIEEYRSALSGRECKYYDRGKGTCPFGNNCFYLHKDEFNVIHNNDQPRTLRDSSGRTQVQGATRLSDYIDTKQ